MTSYNARVDRDIHIELKRLKDQLGLRSISAVLKHLLAENEKKAAGEASKVNNYIHQAR